jgi:hypothetical protein
MSSFKMFLLFLLFPNQMVLRSPQSFSTAFRLSLLTIFLDEMVFHDVMFSFLAVLCTPHFFIWKIFEQAVRLFWMELAKNAWWGMVNICFGRYRDKQQHYCSGDICSLFCLSLIYDKAAFKMPLPNLLTYERKHYLQNTFSDLAEPILSIPVVINKT